MRVSDFHFDLPEELIAHHPPERRTDARLLCLDPVTGELADRRIPDLESLLRPGDLLVLNDTRVIPARLRGRKASGGQVEVLLERITGPREALALVRASKSPGPGTDLHLEGGVTATVLGREGQWFRLAFGGETPLRELLERHGHMPLPPYIRRPDEAADKDRYQTVYARVPGAVAAPTAGLHFDQALLDRLQAGGVERAWVTLHVGAGTFQPLRGEVVEEQHLHRERLVVPAATCAAVARTRARGGRVVAVGTTSVRALESAAGPDGLQPREGETQLFIYPGYRFRCVDALLTNFHLPGSSLVLLVSAFAGRERLLAAYAHAVAARYRFFSYGDAMFIPRPAEGARA